MNPYSTGKIVTILKYKGKNYIKASMCIGSLSHYFKNLSEDKFTPAGSPRLILKGL